MSNFADLWEDTAVAPSKKPAQSAGQSDRELTRTAMLQNELQQAKTRFANATDPQAKAMHQGDIDALNRELGFGKKTQTKQTQPASNNFADLWESTSSTAPSEPSTAGGGRGSYEGYSQVGEVSGKVKAPPVTIQSALENPNQTAKNLLAQGIKGYFDARRELGERGAGAIDTLYGVVPQLYGAAQQALVRPFTTPEKAEQMGQQASELFSQPIGKALGITSKETYQQPLGGITQPIAEQINRMFNVLGMTPEQISEKTGIPTPDIRNMVVIGSAALPQAIKEVSPVVGKVAEAAKQTKVGQQLSEAAREMEFVKPGQAAQPVKAGSVGAAATEANPFAGQLTGEETVRGQFPQIKLSKVPQDVPENEQILRSQIVQQIMPNESVRPGVITGNENTLRNEYTKAKMDTPEGLVYRQQIANEQNALSKYAQDRVDATGASPTLINDEQRGQLINDVFHGTDPEDMSNASMVGYLNQAKKQIYDSAFDKVGNNQITTSHVDSLFSDPQTRATFKAAGTSNLLESAKELIDLAKTVGFKLPDGSIAPAGSVAAYDAVRKHFNSPTIWNRDRAGSIREINGAIDKDIAAVADPALYKLGDNIHKLEKNLFKSKGIDRIFGGVDANGVLTSATPLEKIPQKLNNMPKDQWRHIRDTLNELAQGRIRNAPEGMPPIPEELRRSAAAARAEIDGALAREVQKAGASKAGEWNQNSVNNVLNSVIGQKILETFPPSEIQKYHALNYAGHLMPGVHPYEGAGLQARRVGIIEGNLPKLTATAGATVGGAVAGPTGAAVGGYLGGKAGASAQESLASRAAAKAAEQAQKELKKAAQKGSKLSDLGKQ